MQKLERSFTVQNVRNGIREGEPAVAAVDVHGGGVGVVVSALVPLGPRGPESAPADAAESRGWTVAVLALARRLARGHHLLEAVRAVWHPHLD